MKKLILFSAFAAAVFAASPKNCVVFAMPQVTGYPPDCAEGVFEDMGTSPYDPLAIDITLQGTWDNMWVSLVNLRKINELYQNHNLYNFIFSNEIKALGDLCWLDATYVRNANKKTYFDVHATGGSLRTAPQPLCPRTAAKGFGGLWVRTKTGRIEAKITMAKDFFKDILNQAIAPDAYDVAQDKYLADARVFEISKDSWKASSDYLEVDATKTPEINFSLLPCSIYSKPNECIEPTRSANEIGKNGYPWFGKDHEYGNNAPLAYYQLSSQISPRGLPTMSTYPDSMFEIEKKYIKGSNGKYQEVKSYASFASNSKQPGFNLREYNAYVELVDFETKLRSPDNRISKGIFLDMRIDYPEFDTLYKIKVNPLYASGMSASFDNPPKSYAFYAPNYYNHPNALRSFYCQQLQMPVLTGTGMGGGGLELFLKRI